MVYYLVLSSIPQERQGFSGRIDGVMAVPAQFNVHALTVTNLAQGGQRRREIDVALAELQMVVHPAAHVFDMDVGQTFFPTPDFLNDVLPLAMQVADVQGQTEKRVEDAAVQAGELCHRIDKHSRFRFEGQAHLLATRRLQQAITAGQQSFLYFILGRRIDRRARPETDGIGPEFAGNANRLTQKVEPSLPFFRGGADQRRLMFAPRIQQKPRSRFDHTAQLQPFQLPAQRRHSFWQVRLERVQDVMVEGDPNGPVTKFREDFQSILQAMMGEAVGVIAEQHHLRLGHGEGKVNGFLVTGNRSKDQIGIKLVAIWIAFSTRRIVFAPIDP
jgi:hypothetical protein